MARWLLIFVWLIGYGLSVSLGHAATLDKVDARFQLYYNNKAAQGENLLRIQQQAGQYEVEFNFEHWMSTIRQRARFTQPPPQCAVQPEYYQSQTKRPLQSTKQEEIRFNWSTHEAALTRDKHTERFSLKEKLYDPLSFFFEARCELMDGATSFSFLILHKGEPKVHRYRVVDEVTIDTGLGPLKTLVIERERSSTKRQTRLYVAPELDYLLVQLEHQEGNLVRIKAVVEQLDYTTTMD